ncbi:MAG: DUF4397 domain-containing protein, partial [Chloroflexota bacterium]
MNSNLLSQRLIPILALIIIVVLASIGFTSVRVEAAPERAPRIRIAHLAPFSSSDTAVDIYFNHIQIAKDVSYLDSTQYIDFAAGHFFVSVFDSTSHAYVVGEDIALHSDTDYTIVVIGDGDNRHFDIVVIEDDNSEVEDGNFRLRLAHFAPFAERLRDTRADIRLQDGTPVVENVRFGDVAHTLELPAGEYDLKITTVGGETTLIDPAPVSFNAGDIVSAFAIGDGDKQPLGVFAYVNDSVGVSLPLVEPKPEIARLYVAHLAPFASGSGTSVSIKLNGEIALEKILYGDSTGYIELPTGDYSVE